MTVQHVRVDEVLQLRRTAVVVEPGLTYAEIGLRSFGKGVFHKAPVVGSDLGDKRVFVIKPGDLLLSNVFAWEGAIAVAGPGEAGRIGSHRFMTYRPIDNRVDTGWARYFFLSEVGLTLIRGASPGSAGRNRTLGIGAFGSLLIPLPNRDEQTQTAEHLDASRALATELEHRLAGATAESLLRVLPKLTQDVISQRAVNRRRVGELADIVSDVVHPGDRTEPAEAFVGLQHVEPHSGVRLGADPLGAEKGRKFRFRPGDVVYGYLRPYQNKVMCADMHGLCSVDQYVLRPRPGVDSRLLAHLLRSQQVLEAAVSLTHSLQLPRLRSGLLLGIEVDIPDESATAVLDELVGRVRQASVLRREQTAIARAIPTSLVNEAFRHLR